MTLATYEEVVDAEIVLTDSDAEEFDLRFQYALGGYAEARQELIDCIQFVRGSDVAERLGFKSRGDYIADRVAGLNVKWAVEDRRSLVEIMTNSKMSTTQQRDVLNLKSHATVLNDQKELVKNDKLTGTREVEGSDGKTRTYATSTDWPEVPQPEPEPERDSMTVALINDLRGPWRRGITSAAKKMTQKERQILIDAIETTLNELKEI